MSKSKEVLPTRFGTYDSSLLLVRIADMLLDAFLTSEINETITKVLLLACWVPSQTDVAWDVVVTSCVSIRRHHLWIGPLRLMTNET